MKGMNWKKKPSNIAYSKKNMERSYKECNLLGFLACHDLMLIAFFHQRKFILEFIVYEGY
jgi:hypothetical protein